MWCFSQGKPRFASRLPPSARHQCYRDDSIKNSLRSALREIVRKIWKGFAHKDTPSKENVYSEVETLHREFVSIQLHHNAYSQLLPDSETIIYFFLNRINTMLNR